MIHILDHHAYCIAGQPEYIIPRILSWLEKKVGYRAKGNTDFRLEQYEVMGIDEARALKEATERKAVAGEKKIFIISARGITKEAQNALLKVIEEPPADTHFFLLVPTLEILLPTVRSRIHVEAGLAEREKSSKSSLAVAFLSDSIPKRLKTVQGLLKKAEEEAGKRTLVDFFDELERAIAEARELKPHTHEDKESTRALSEIFEVKKYSHDRAPSFKLLLEHLALVLPQW